MRRLWIVGGLLLVACNNGNGDNNSRLEGTYQGTYAVAGQTAALTIVATQTGNAVSGTYTLDGDRGTFAANVNGRDFSAVLSSSVVAGVSCNSTGTYDDDEASGITSCSDGSNGSFHVRRIG